MNHILLPTQRAATEITEEIQRMQRHIAVYSEYRDICIERRDRHGIMDAEADMRELEASIRALQLVLGGERSRHEFGDVPAASVRTR